MSPEFAEHLHQLINEINEKLHEHDIQASALLNTKASLQNICKHKFESEGRDHVYHYEKCTVCGFTRKD